MLVKLSKTIDYYVELNSDGFESNTKALESFMDINARRGIDSYIKPAPTDHIEARVIFELPEGVPVNHYIIKNKAPEAR